MNLVVATLLSGALVTACGLLLATYPSRIRKALTRFPRSRTSTLVLLVVATSLVLYRVTQLGEADFGKYKNILFGFFLLLSVGAWFKVPDFLGVRALAVLGLLFASVLLHSAFLEPPQSRHLLTVFSYLVIIGCLYLAAVPYRFRDMISAINQRHGIRRVLGIATTLYGLLLLLAPLTF